MELNFIEAIAALGPRAAFRIANAVRPPTNYLFNSLLPERAMPSYYVDSGNMTVRTTMAGLVGMDSPYPPGGVVELSTFLEKSAKMAIDVALTEGTLRQIQEMLAQLMMNGGNSKEALSSEVLNFLNKVVLQALMDRDEWLRGQALQTGAINWTFNQKNLLVDYGVPSANFLTARAGNDAYNGSASKFWTDVRAAQKLLRYSVRAVIANSDTLNAIVDNPVNATMITAQSVGGFSLQKYLTIGGNTVPSTEARDRITLIAYDEEGEIFDPADPSTTITVPFMTAGKVLFVGNNNRSGYRVGQGSTDDPTEDLALGYHHMAPTVEGGSPGRWARLFTPEGQPWQLRGQAAENSLPVIEAPKKIVVATSTIS